MGVQESLGVCGRGAAAEVGSSSRLPSSASETYYSPKNQDKH